MNSSLKQIRLVDLLNSWATTAAWCCTSARHATLRHITTTTATCSLVDLHHDWVDNALKLFLLAFELVLLRKLILVQPIERFLHGLFDLVLIIALELVLQLL